MTIDALVPERWPEEIVASLDCWRQGHLLPLDCGVWVGPRGWDPVTGQTASTAGDRPRVLRASLSELGWYALVSQTCDIAGAGPGAKQPFVQVCPIVDVSGLAGDGRLGLVKRGDVTDLVYLTSPPVAGASWAVDLRVSIPISKALLVDLTPAIGFASEADELVLGRRVAAKLARPAVHDLLSGTLAPALRTFVEAHKGDPWIDDLEQFRFDISGSRLAPESVRLIVVADVPLGLGATQALRAEWKRARRHVIEAGMAWVPIAVRQLSKLSISEYRNSIPIDIPQLARGRFS